MTPERWHQITDLFDAATRRDPSDREAFVAAACGDDDQLLAEVRSLLDVHREATHSAADGTVPGHPFRPGRTIGAYRIEGLLGRGGMGDVYRARDTDLDRDVALKVLPESFAADPDRLARFKRESHVLASLSHPHIAGIHGLEKSGPIQALVLELVDGPTLAEQIAQGPMAPGDVVTIARQILEALDVAHAAGVVHRDIKPANVMVATRGGVKIVDFGLARLPGADVTRPGLMAGTVAYMAPEQFRGVSDTRVDLWALGVVMYEMLTGRQPFARDDAPATMDAVLNHQPAPVRALRPDVPPAVAAVVDRALEKAPSNRFTTAREMLAGLEAIPPAAASTAERWWKRVAALAVGGAIATGAWFYAQNARTAWAREQAIPEIERLIDAGRWFDAFQLAAEARRVIPMDPAWARLDPVVTRRASIQTVPDGATVCYQSYAAPADQWTCLGETPIQEASIPNAVLTWRAQKPGFEPALDVTTGGYLGVYPGAPAVIEKTFKLQRPDAVPPGMVYVTPGDAPFRISVPRLDHLPGVELRDFWIDRTEVTNRDFARFVDSGGYRDPRYWRVPFERDGRQLLFEDAIALFKDASGRPGPATWEAGRYPEGQDDYPVSGVSWYEAAAYAVFVGKSLPTIYHWSRAAGHRLSGAIVPRSNFSNRGPMKAGGVGGMHHFGTVDLAGNAKEWCWNRADSTRRYILGGAWDEPVYMFNDLDARSPFDRAANFGFRLVKYGPDDALPGSDNELIAFEARDYRHEKPATDELFEAYLRLYAYDRGDLATKAETSDDSHPEWRVERVSFQAAYADERVPALVFLPKRSRPPYQAVVIFPGSDAFTQRSSAQINPQSFDWIIRSGRAVMYPIYKNTYERGDGLPPVLPSRTVTWRDDVIASAKDVRRAVDYLESRPDIDRTRLAFLGGSRGAAMGPIFVAVEPRFKAALLYLGGFFFQHSLPEVDAFNFAPRVRVPVLLLSGRFDFIFPTDTSQLPMFDLFQPPDGQKRRVVYDTGHNLPRAELIRETLEWLDTYLGKPSE